MDFVDTHCHIHEAGVGPTDDNPTRARWLRSAVQNPDQMIQEANAAGVTQLICVGTTLEDSWLATEFAAERPAVWASIGLHPHEARHYAHDPVALAAFAGLARQPKVLAVGECGLDFYYNHSSRETQAAVLRFQIELALRHNLPLIFHVRDAFDDFWPVLDNYPGVRGVIHSFSATERELDAILARGLYVGLNGIVTFSGRPDQLAAFRRVPLDRLVLEIDAPFLTPTPYRGTICMPKHVRVTAEFLAQLKDETVEHIASVTSGNARHLFHLAEEKNRNDRN